jgi:hypothetical protein
MMCLIDRHVPHGRTRLCLCGVCVYMCVLYVMYGPLVTHGVLGACAPWTHSSLSVQYVYVYECILGIHVQEHVHIHRHAHT